MTMLEYTGKNNELFIRVESGNTLSGIVNEVFGPFQSHNQWMKKTESILKSNPHIKSPNLLYPGQLIALGLDEGGHVASSSHSELELAEMETFFSELTGEERDHLFDNFEVFEVISEIEQGTSESNQLVLDFFSALFEDYSFKTYLQIYLEQLRKGQRPSPGLIFDMESRITRIVDEFLYRFRSSRLRFEQKLGLNLKNSKRIVLRKNPKHYQPYLTKLRIIKNSRKLLKHTPKGLTFIDVATRAYNVMEAPAEKKRRVILKEAGGFTFGAVGASKGAAAGYAACTASLSLLTGFTSPLWCLLAGFAGAYTGGAAMSSLGESLGEKIDDSLGSDSHHVLQPQCTIDQLSKSQIQEFNPFDQNLDLKPVIQPIGNHPTIRAPRGF